MKKTVFTLTFVILIHFLFSQTDSLLNSKGAINAYLQNINNNIADSTKQNKIHIIKNGYFKCFLTKGIERTDSSDAVFYGYELYINGYNCIGYRFYHNRFRRHCNIKYSFDFPPKIKPTLLNGTIKYYSIEENLIICEETYENGLPVKLISYHYKKNDTTPYPYEILDFTKKLNKQIGSFYYEERKLNGKIKKYWCLNNGEQIKISNK